MIRILILLGVLLVIGLCVAYVVVASRRDPDAELNRERLARAETLINQLQYDAAEHMATEPFARIVHDEIRQYEKNDRKQLR